MSSTTAIVVAGGSGKRYGGFKQIDSILGIPLLRHTVSRFQASPDVDQIVLVLNEKLLDYGGKLQDFFKKIKEVVSGGRTRAESVYKGVLTAESEYILVHDAVRPVVSMNLIHRVRRALEEYDIVVPVIPLRDTVKYFENHFISGLIEREKMVQVQTPQGSRRHLLLSAYEKLGDEALKAPDESTLIEWAHGINAFTVEGDFENIKVTYPEDKRIVETYIQRNLRVGYGYDIHKLEQGDGLWICGVKIPAGISSVGHSDADVCIHALIDALLGASGLGNIGEMFPDTSPEYKGVSSSKLLKSTVSLLNSKGISVINVDITVKLENPRIAPFLEKMKNHLSSLLGIDKLRVSIKGKRGEGVGPVGRGEAVESVATVLIVSPF